MTIRLPNGDEIDPTLKGMPLRNLRIIFEEQGAPGLEEVLRKAKDPDYQLPGMLATLSA